MSDNSLLSLGPTALDRFDYEPTTSEGLPPDAQLQRGTLAVVSGRLTNNHRRR